MKIRPKHILITLGTMILVPILLVALIIGLVYFPPFQKWALNEVGSRMEDELGMKVHIEDVRITPFLDLVAEGVVATDTEGDTLIHAEKLTFDVAFKPLFDGRADIEGFRLENTELNTKSLISDIHIKGTVGELTANAHGVEWTKELVHLDDAILKNADLNVALTDTAAKDTTSSKVEWIIDVDKAKIENTKLHLTLPPDSTTSKTTYVEAMIADANLQKGHFDLGEPLYTFEQLKLLKSDATVGTLDKLQVDTLVSLTNLGVIADTLSYNKDNVLKCGVRNLAFQEKRYGLDVQEISGQVLVDSTHIELPSFAFHTPNSRINANLNLDWDALKSGDLGKMKCTVDAAIDRDDINNLLATAVREKYITPGLLKSLRKNEYVKPFLASDVNLQATISGNKDNINVENYKVVFPKLLTAQGNLKISDDYNDYSGKVKAYYQGSAIDGKFKTNLRNEKYDVDAYVTNFPLRKFVKGVDVSNYTGRIKASGKGFDMNSIKTNCTASTQIQHLNLMGYDLSGLNLDANLAGNIINAKMAVKNYLGDISGNVRADISNGYKANAHFTLDNIDVTQLSSLGEQFRLHSDVDIEATASKDLKRISASGALTNNYVEGETRSALYRDILFNFDTSPKETSGNVSSGDLDLALRVDGDLDRLTSCADKLMKEVNRQIENRAIDHEALRKVLPNADLSLHAGKANPLAHYLQLQGTEMSSIDLDLNTNSHEGINGYAQLGMLKVGALQLDTIHGIISQDSEGIKVKATAHNYLPDNPNHFRASVDGCVVNQGASAMINFLDAKGVKGIDLGLNALLEDGAVRFQLYPHNPVIAYRSLAVNDDNFISINPQGMIRADLQLIADDGTGLAIYSEPTDESQNDITLSLSNVNLGELSNVLPYLPKFDGILSGDIHVLEEHGDSTSISAMGSIDAENFAYEGTKIGNIGAEVVYMPKENGEHYADAFITYEGTDVGECSGVYYDTDGHFNGDLKLVEFPLQIVNAFLDGTDFLMRGAANGEFAVNGTLDKPVMNGNLVFEDSHFYSPVYGVDFSMDSTSIPLTDSRLIFKNYLLNSGNSDLKLNGDINMQDLSNIYLNLSMKANDFQLINSSRSTSSLVYGKVLSDFNGTVRGNVNDLIIRGNLDILPGTDATYLLSNSPLTVNDRLADLVTFMDFTDTTKVEEPVETSEFHYDVSMGINVADGAKFHCLISNNGDSYVNVAGGGNLVLRMTQQGVTRMTGRYTIQEGEMKYELPVIPLKTFKLEQGSYVEFTGDMMNPRLSITATENTKAVVTENDLQRSVNFLVGVEISRTLEDMGLAFTLDAPEDLTVQNQIAAMSEEDRYKSAVALLATGMFITEDFTSGFKASNALNSFLQSEIQSIAGKALSTFDLSFGMENGTSAVGTSTTDYSFQFSKRFFDDRVSFNIGGSVETGEDASNSAASFIDNISIEYRLDNSGTRYVRIFYDREAHDPLEGTMMETGAGLVLRRKTDRLGDLFLFRKRKK